MDIAWIWIPLLACVALTGILAWFGIHVLARGVVFVDLALAQIAALGAVTALFVGLEPGTTGSWLFSLGFTLFGAAVFSVTRTRGDRVPQEAIIGVVYAVASAAALVLMSRVDDLHAVEKIRAILSGRSIVFVELGTVLRTVGVYAGVAMLHFVFRREFLLVSLEPERARAQAKRIALWDFLFYASFGLVITSSVQIAGVLLVFSFLIVPSIVSALLAERLRARLLVGWATGFAASSAGLLLSYELPSGSVIVVCFGTILLLVGVGRYVSRAERRALAIGRVAACAAGLALVAAVIALAPWPAKAPAALARRPAASSSADQIRAGLAAADANERERALTAFAARADASLLDALLAAFGKEGDADLGLRMATEGLRLGDARFLGGLVELTLSLDSPFYREEAAQLLAEYTEFELADPVGDAELARLRAWWDENGPRLRWDEGRGRFVR